MDGPTYLRNSARHEQTLEVSAAQAIPSSQKIVEVDNNTFQGLCLAQKAIQHTHQVLHKGSCNQSEHIYANRAGQSHGKFFFPTSESILDAMRALERTDTVYYLIGDRKEYYVGFLAGLGYYYQGGSCGLHKVVAMNYLLQHAPVGCEVMTCDAKNIDHECAGFSVLNDDGHPVLILCDAYPANEPQAVLAEHYFIRQEDLVINDPMLITEHTRGVNYIAEVYARLDAQSIKDALRDFKKAGELPAIDVAEYKKGLCGHLFSGLGTTNENYFCEYVTAVSGNQIKFSDVCRDLKNDRTELLSPLIDGNGKNGIELSPAFLQVHPPVLPLPLMEKDDSHCILF